MAKKRRTTKRRDTSVPYSTLVGQAHSENNMMRAVFRVFMALSIYNLYEKLNATDEQVDIFMKEMEYILDSCDKGYIESIFDFDECMEEYGIEWDGHLPRRKAKTDESKDE